MKTAATGSVRRLTLTRNVDTVAHPLAGKVGHAVPVRPEGLALPALTWRRRFTTAVDAASLAKQINAALEERAAHPILLITVVGAVTSASAAITPPAVAEHARIFLPIPTIVVAALREWPVRLSAGDLHLPLWMCRPAVERT
jgi:hypothetical protein